MLHQFQTTCHTIASIILKIIGRRLKSILPQLMKNLRLGIKAKKEGLGTKITTRKIKLNFTKQQNTLVRSAIKNILGKKENNQTTFALTDVSPRTEGKPALIILKKVAICVVKNLSLIDIEKQNAAQKNVRRVYDISVEGCHEYVANGLLVSNSWDSIRYALSKMIKNRMIGFTEKQKRDNNKRVKTTIAPSMEEKSW